MRGFLLTGVTLFVFSLSAVAKTISLSEFKVANAKCLVGDLKRDGIIPEFRHFIMPQAPANVSFQRASGFFEEDSWEVASRSAPSRQFPFGQNFATTFRREGTTLHLASFISGQKSRFFTASNVPYIYYRNWSPKYDASKELIEAETAVSDFYVIGSNKSGEIQFVNTNTNLILDLKVSIKDYLACLKTTVRDLNL